MRLFLLFILNYYIIYKLIKTTQITKIIIKDATADQIKQQEIK